MRPSILSLLSILSLCTPVYGQSVIRCLAWELDTARPALQEWSLVRGETVDLECRYLAGPAAMDVRGAAVVLHCRTNGMPADLSFQVTGSVGRVSSTNLASVGWVTVRVRPDLDLPHDVTRCTFTLESTLNSARNLVASGTLRLAGDPTGATPAALALNLYDPFGAAQTMGERLDADLLHAMTVTVPAQVNAATTGLVNVEDVETLIAEIPPPDTAAQIASATGGLASAASLSASLSSLHITRCYDPENTNRWGEFGPSNTIVVSEIRKSYVFNANGATIYGSAAPFASSAHPFASTNETLQYVWSSSVSEAALRLAVTDSAGNFLYGEWTCNNAPTGTVNLLGDSPDSAGVVTVDITSVTNSVSYYVFTNAPPDWIWTMGSLDVLQGWLNGYFYGKDASDARYLSKISTPEIRWTAAGTNALYIQRWDVTNNTFIIEEIIP